MSLHLTKKVFDPNAPLLDGRRLPTYVVRVEASVDDGDPMPPEIFVWQAFSVLSAAEPDVCKAVASLSNLSTYPITAARRDPQDNTAVPFYRLAFAEFHCETAADVEELWAAIQADAKDLCANWRAAANPNFEDDSAAFATS